MAVQSLKWYKQTMEANNVIDANGKKETETYCSTVWPGRYSSIPQPGFDHHPTIASKFRL